MSQVLSWVSAVLALGEAFSGDDSRQLWEALASAAKEAFVAFHTTQLQRLQAGLSRESWRRADVDTAGATLSEAALVSDHLHAWCRQCYQMAFAYHYGSNRHSACRRPTRSGDGAAAAAQRFHVWRPVSV